MYEWFVSKQEYRVQPVWLREALREIKSEAGKIRLPIVEWKQKGPAGAGDLVIMTKRDFIDWYSK